MKVPFAETIEDAEDTIKMLSELAKIHPEIVGANLHEYIKIYHVLMIYWFASGMAKTARPNKREETIEDFNDLWKLMEKYGLKFGTRRKKELLEDFLND